MADQQLTVSEFAAKIKAKYPEYKDIDDLELSRKIVDKYPEYESLVVFEDPKKKEETQEPFQFGVSDTELLSPSQETKEPTEEVAVDRSPTIGEWFGNIWNGLSEGVTDFLYPAAESTGLTDKNILSFVKQNQEEYPDLFEAYEKSLSNSAIQSNFTGEKAEELAARTAYSQYWESDPSIENKVVPFIRGERREEAVKKTGVEIPEDIKRSLDEQFWNSSLKGLASSLPAMVASSPTAGGSFVIQSYYAREEEIARTLDENPDLEMTEAQKEAYKVTGALVEGALEKIGLSGALKGSPALTKLVTAGVIDKALKGTKKVGKETLDRYINETVQEVGKRVAGGTVAEFETGTLQQLSDDALKAVVNAAQGEEFFEPKSIANVFKDALYAGAQEAVGGGLISSVSTLGMSSNERKLKDIDSEIENLKQKREGAKTEEEKTIIDDVITDLTEEQNKERQESFKLYSKFSQQDLIEVQSLNNQIRELSSKYNIATSETLKEKYKKEVDDLRARKQELENKYSEEKVRYIKDGKEYSKGEFVDMINKATPEEIATGQWGVQNDAELEQLLVSKLPQDDSKKEERVPSTEQKEKAPVKAEPVQEGGVKAPPTSGVVQEEQVRELKLSDKVTLKSGEQVTAKNPVDGSEIQGTITIEGDIDNPRVSVETETDIVELGAKEDIKPSDIKPFAAAVAEAETLTANEDGTLTYNKEGNPVIAKGTKLTIDTDKGLASVSVFSEGKFVPLTEDADKEKGLRVQMINQDGETVQLYGQDALDATYNIMLAMNEAETEQLNKLLDNEKTINAIAEAEESARKDTKPTQEAERAAVEEARTEEVEITLLEENGSVKPLTKSGPTTDPRNVQTGKMTIEYGDKGITFKTTEDTGRMKEEGGEIFVSNEQISKMPNIGKFEKNTKEYAQHVASMSGIADPKPEIDPIEGLMSRAIKVEDIGKEGTASAKRFTAKQGEQLTAMVNNFEKILKSSGARRVKVLFFNQGDSVAYRSYKTGKDSFASKGSFFDNTIVVNIDSADMSTLPHEMLHAYISSVKMNNKKIVQFTNAIENELNKGSNSERELAKELSAFRDRYIEEEVYGKGKTKEDALIAEEFLAQYVGLLSTASENMPKAKQLSFIDKIRAAVVKFLSKIGIVDKNLVAKIKTREDALNFINGFVDALQGRVAPTAKPEVQVEEQGESGEVGTISIPKEQIEVIDAPKASEDPRGFVKEFVTDINIKELSGRKFVTNMYDYTNAGLTALGNSLSINLLGGRNYVALMLERNGKKLGEVSNLAAFNTKAQAEGFIRNAKEGKADLFAPHSGTLTDSWQFQHHIFEELVNLVLDNKIMSKAKLMETFNEAIKSKEGAKAFQAFNEKNKSRFKNLNSFKKDPMKLVELLNAENNYSPNLRKALNQKIASSKDFQKAIGIKNLNEFYSLIADPLNAGVSGGEIMTFVEFDPKTFEVVKPKSTDADFHPSFAWTVKAKIKRILQPNKYYKSYDLTKEYTKYNVSGPEVSTKEDPKFAVSNVTSSAGAIPKVAKVAVREQIEWQSSDFGRDKVNSSIITRGQFLQQAAQDLLEGKITNEEYQETVKIVSEIDPIAKFFLPASNEDMQNALGKAKSKKLNVQLEDGEYVGLRLDIPAYVNSNIWVVTAHKGTGAPLTYGSVAWATDVSFGTNPKVAAFIAAGKNYDLVGRYRIDEVEVDGKTVYKFFDSKTGKYYAEKGVDVTKNSYNEAGRYRADRLEKQDKSTIGKMLGKWKNFEGKTKEEKDASAVKKVEEIVKIESGYPGAGRKGSPWRQIGMNPFRHSYFYDRRNGKPVIAAAEVVQIGGLVYAKDVEYADWSDDQFTVNGYYDADGQPVKFQLDTDESAKVEKEAFSALEKGEIPAPLYKKSMYQKVYKALFRTELETEVLKLQEKREAQISASEEESRLIANRIKKYASTPKALELSNEYLTSENKKNAKEAILKLPNGNKLLSELRTARAFIDNISNELVNDPAFDGLDDELRLAIQDNLTTYLRTQYRFFTDKSFNIDKRRNAAVQGQFDQLVAQEIALLSVMGMSPLDIQTDINKRREDIAAEAAQMIDAYISDLQDVKYQPSKGGAGIKMPNAPFRRKKDLPDYIQQLLGKEKDPVRKFSQTSQALANVLYKGRMIDGVIDLVGSNSDYILDTEPTSPKDKQYTKVNDPYSKLNGKWVHNEIMDMVDQKPLYQAESLAGAMYFNTLKLARKSKVIWNITTWRKNLTGGWYFILANGIANPRFAKDFTERTKLMFKVRGEKFKPDAETEQLMSLMAKYGVSGKSIDANLIGLSQAAYQFGLDGDENAYYSRAKQVFNNISNKDKWLQEKYAAVDDYTKLIIFRSEIQTYAKKLYGKEYSELNESQKDNVHEQAAERVKQSTPTFSRLPKWFNKVAVIPIIGDFISFRLESLRSYGMNVANGVSDIKKSQDSGLNDVQKKAYLQAGLRRLAGSGSVFALKLAITKLLTQLFLSDEEEDLEDDVKKLRPEWMKGQSIIPRSIDKDGNVRVYNYSSEDPYGDVSDIFGGPESWGAMVTDFVRPNIAADLIFNLSKGEDIYGRKIADYSDSKLNQTLDVLGYTAKQIVVPPTISSSFRDAWLKSELPKKDRAINLASTIAERSIIRDYKYNVVDSFVNDLRKISGTRKSYLDYDNPAKRLKQLDEIKSQWQSIVAIGLAKNNYDMIDKAERYMKRHLEPLDEDYVFEGIIIKK